MTKEMFPNARGLISQALGEFGTQMYYISASDEQGENLSMFVEATDEDVAFELVQQFWEANAFEPDLTDTPPVIFTVPRCMGQSRVVYWDDVESTV